MTIPAVKTPPQADIIEQVLLKGDLSKLTPEERTAYYLKTCESLGLNPMTKPFEYVTLNSRLQLYALRTATDQLRKINGVSLEILSRDVADDILTVHVRAKLPDGRVDEDLGSVPFSSTLKGEARANAELKAVTKAKRRVTLSICGLGWLDETEVSDIPHSAENGSASARRPPPPAANPMRSDRLEATSPPTPPHDPETGEIIDADAPTDMGDDESDLIRRYDAALAEAAEQGTAKLAAIWNAIPKSSHKF